MSEPRVNRREFFRSVARAAAGGVLAAVGAVLLARGRRGGCKGAACGKCPTLSACGLPAAQAQKHRTWKR